MCLLSVWKPHILPLDHPVTINCMIRSHLQWWMNTNRFETGTTIHPPDPKFFLYTDASHFGWGAHLEHSFPQPLCRGMENSQLVPGTQHRYQSSSHSRQIQHSCRPPIKIRQTYQDRMGSGSNSSEFSIPDAHFPKCGPVCDTIQSQTPIICLSSTRQQSNSNRCPVHGLETSSCICFSSFYSDTCCSGKNLTTSVQNSSDSSVLATTTVVLRTSSSFSVSSDLSATNSKILDSIQRKICSSKPPTSRPSHLGVIKQSIRDKKKSQNVADFVSRSRRTSTQKVYDAKWTIFSN